MINTKNKKLILIGEQHGTKEIPEFLTDYFSNLKEEINLCLEIPKDFQNNLSDFFKINDGTGLCTLEYLNFVKQMQKLKIKMFCIVADYKKIIKNQNKGEKIMADNILEVMKNNKKTFVILGNVHACKKKVFNIETIGFLLNKKLKNDLMSINILDSKTDCPKDGFDKIIFIDSIKLNRRQNEKQS